MPAAPQITVKHRLLDELLGGSLREYVQVRRSARDSWQRISFDLSQEVGLYVSFESLRSWFPEYRNVGDAA